MSNVKYNITDALSTPIKDSSAPIYMTIGDGGNVEGLADRYTCHLSSFLFTFMVTSDPFKKIL